MMWLVSIMYLAHTLNINLPTTEIKNVKMEGELTQL